MDAADHLAVQQDQIFVFGNALWNKLVARRRHPGAAASRNRTVRDRAPFPIRMIFADPFGEIVFWHPLEIGWAGDRSILLCLPSSADDIVKRGRIERFRSLDHQLSPIFKKALEHQAR